MSARGRRDGWGAYRGRGGDGRGSGGGDGGGHRGGGRRGGNRGGGWITRGAGPQQQLGGRGAPAGAVPEGIPQGQGGRDGAPQYGSRDRGNRGAYPGLSDSSAGSPSQPGTQQWRGGGTPEVEVSGAGVGGREGEPLGGVRRGEGAWGRGSGVQQDSASSSTTPPTVGAVGRRSGVEQDASSSSTTPPKKKHAGVAASSPPPSSPFKTGRLVPIPRPDGGGSSGARKKLLVNHFPVTYDPNMSIYRYELDARSAEVNPEGASAAAEISTPVFLAIKSELFRLGDDLRDQTAAYDGHRYLYSPAFLPEGDHEVVARGRRYHASLRFQKQMPLSDLLLTPRPRDVLQGLDVILIDNSRSRTLSFGRCFYFKGEDLLDQQGHERLIVALRGFQQSIRSTEQGLVLNVDHSVLVMTSPTTRVTVIQYLEQRVPSFNPLSSDYGWRKNVERQLRGLKVRVTHRQRGQQKFTVFGLTKENAENITFEVDGSKQARRLVDYYADKYSHEIRFGRLPCLELSQTTKNYVPMELCELVEGQRYPDDGLFGYEVSKLKKTSEPKQRQTLISKTMGAPDGPARGDMLDSFNVLVRSEMATVPGRVLDPPSLKLKDTAGRACMFRIQNRDSCQWNLTKKHLAAGVNIERWGLAVFSDKLQRLDPERFINKLVERCRELGITISRQPVVRKQFAMGTLSYPFRVKESLDSLKQEAGGRLQILICPMEYQSEGYKTLKLVAETLVGILTQCCLIEKARDDKGQGQYLSNLALKINAKLGGTNFLLWDPLPLVRVMFVGADVNHPGSWDKASPSVAAVVASVDWPWTNRYFSRLQALRHRQENIVGVGLVCRELVDKYARAHKGAKPEKIIYFRDGVSDSQFDMVLNEELADIKTAVESEGYKPTFTVVVAQKRHRTRFFPPSDDDTFKGNVRPGTVVDTEAVAPGEFNFYLCSHPGTMGTSRPTHYYVLYDDNKFTSDQLQRLTYDLCFTFARCTKPVSLVPPVSYADSLANRGRHYLEARANKAWESAPPAHLDHAEELPRVHQDIEDTMYFI